MRSLILTDNEEQEFWSLVALGGPDDCWLWLGGVNGDGYGYFKKRRANRLAYALTYGDPRHFVLHKCRKRRCCNPGHLYDGTHAQNMKDMSQDGTHDGHNRRSEGHPGAVLSNEEVLAIRASSDKGVELAKRYGVSQATISSIRHRTRWQYL